MLDNCSVLVTGATGVVGQHLVEVLLEQGARVRVLTRNVERANNFWPGRAVDIFEVDLNHSPLGPVCEGIDVLFHLASYQPGPGAVNPESGEEHFRVTVEGTRALLQAGKAIPSFVFVSSTRVEEGSDSDYGRAKKAAEQLVLAAGNQSQQVSVLRLPPVYGAMNGGMIATIVAGVYTGRFKVLPDFGERRSLVHRDDVARALLLMATDSRANRRTFTVTDGVDYSLSAIYEMTCEALGRKPRRVGLPLWMWRWLAAIGSGLQSLLGRPMPITRERFARMQADAWFDGSAIEKELGFKPGYTLTRALPELIAEYRGGPSPG